MRKTVPNDPETRSADLLSENIEKLKVLFPDAVTDGRIDFDVLSQLLGGAVEESEERYGLNWHGKRKARRLALTPSTGTLRPCPDESVDWDTTQNLMIEGDNLEVLKLLQKSYAGKVRLIYIDPPYNRGKDFIYRDNYRDNIRNYLEFTGQVDGERRKLSSNAESSGRFHTDWLNMMYPRLKLARDLLSDDGALFVSIDENEFFNIRCVLGQVFGDENLVAEIAVSLNPKGRQITKFFATSHEYLVVFAKNIEKCSLDPTSPEEVDEGDFPHVDAVGNFRFLPLRNTNKKFNPQNRPNLYFPLYVDGDTGIVSCNPTAKEQEVFPVFGDGSPAVWRWSRPKVNKEKKVLVGRRVRGVIGCRLDVFQKDYLTEGRTKKLKTVWQSTDVGSTDSAVAELKALMQRSFDSPKPTRLIRRIIRTMPPECTVLDFFAGSGTTGQAVMSEVLEGRRLRYILVQIPRPIENSHTGSTEAGSLCEGATVRSTIAELTKERLRRAATEAQKGQSEAKGDFGFRVFRLDTSNIRTWDPDPDDLAQSLLENRDHIKPDRTENDILCEVLLKLGLDLSAPIETRTIAGRSVWSVAAGTLIACLGKEEIDQEVAEPLALGIVEWQEDLVPSGGTTVVFRDGAFADDVAKTNVTAILDQHGLGNVRSL